MDLVFQPLVPWPIVSLAALAVVVLGALGLYRSLKGSALRVLIGLALVLALANPVLRQEEREPLSTIVPVIVDQSQSQQLPERQQATKIAAEALKERLSRIPGVEPRIVEAKADPASDTPSTRLFGSLADATADVPAGRVGAALFLTDGQVHDIPANGRPPGLSVPVSSLITGRAGETDRRIEVLKAPRFGLKGKEVEVLFRVTDDGADPGRPARVTVRVNGSEAATLEAVTGAPTPFRFEIGRAGANVVELSAEALQGEITDTNNRAIQVVEGIRENMRVLLVSGEPHAGERTWRNLLKSDASVDLVHFTILRPPQKQDGTPINELSLIAFPTQELFVDKINEFDLIIFDRYQHRGVLPLLYYDYIAQYVDRGGALLIAAGPEHAGEDSIALTPLEGVLPAAPDGMVIERGFYPRISAEGRKHPVTRGLEGGASEPPRWGRWFRTIGVEQPAGRVVMEGPDERPLLVLNRAGEGRVAMLLSDQGWLWARNFEGGGPHAALYRRIAHWLMKDPDLEEEALRASASGRSIFVTRQTMEGNPGAATLRTPSGKDVPLTLTESEPGLFRAEAKVDETGLFEVVNGDLTALVHVGTPDAPEFKAMISTEERLRPVAEETGGIVARLGDPQKPVIPDILPVRGNARVEADGRVLVRMSTETVLKGVSTLPLLGGYAGVLVLLLGLGFNWWREGR
ncbi:hypothetical protein [Gellertiella hungarica]|uniref:Glutamine amidotransferase domain-containing protein n=1 Tax=Gellertiella hungarica TaxID=1572859 RepID=A0A7W6NJG6_9HYPH|nr:hypothetical protein [Gellertiella hungarica]MBB4063370.1 hypothetical protein [Gellertiella hungarica]